MKIKKIIIFILSILLFSCFDNLDSEKIEVNSTRLVKSNTGTEESSYYQSFTKKIDLTRTALVLIDTWDDTPLLEDLIKYKLVPLLKLARKKKMTIVHCPSQRPNIHQDIDPQPGELVILGYKDFDHELKLRGIDTLIYAGFDTLLCVIDKPCGVFSTKLRHNDFKRFILSDCVLSSQKEKKMVGLDIIEKQFAYSLTLEELYNACGKNPPAKIFNTVETRSIGNIPDPSSSETSFNKLETALVVVGASDQYQNPGWQTRVTENMNKQNGLLDLIALARQNNIKIIYAPGDNEIAASIAPIEGDIVVNSYSEFITTINGLNIRKLVYAGYPLNEDVLFGDAGITRLYMRNRYQTKYTPKYYILSDCTLAYEQAGTLSTETIKKYLLNYYRGVKTITFSHFENNIY